MVAPRANWKGFIKFGEVSCPVALYTAASSSERIAFNTLNRKTGNRVKREFVDSETGDPVERAPGRRWIPACARTTASSSSTAPPYAGS